MYYASTIGNNATLTNEERWGKREFGNADNHGVVPENRQKTEREPLGLDFSSAFEEVDVKVDEAIKPFDRIPGSEYNKEAKNNLSDLSAVAKEVCGKENVEPNNVVDNTHNALRPETPSVSDSVSSVTTGRNDMEEAVETSSGFRP